MTWFTIARATIITGIAAIIAAIGLAFASKLGGRAFLADLGGAIAMGAIVLCLVGPLIMVGLLHRTHQQQSALTLGTLARAGIATNSQGFAVIPPRCAECGAPVEGYNGTFTEDRRRNTWLTQVNEPCGHEAFRHALTPVTIPRQASGNGSESH